MSPLGRMAMARRHLLPLWRPGVDSTAPLHRPRIPCGPLFPEKPRFMAWCHTSVPTAQPTNGKSIVPPPPPPTVPEDHVKSVNKVLRMVRDKEGDMKYIQNAFWVLAGLTFAAVLPLPSKLLDMTKVNDRLEVDLKAAKDMDKRTKDELVAVKDDMRALDILLKKVSSPSYKKPVPPPTPTPADV